MDNIRAARAWTLIGVAVLAITVGAMARRSRAAAEEMRDAVASPISPALLGGARMAQADLGYFSGPALRRAEAEHTLMSSRRPEPTKSMLARAAKLRRERALAVTAQ